MTRHLVALLGGVEEWVPTNVGEACGRGKKFLRGADKRGSGDHVR